MKTAVVQSTFSGGETTPRLSGRPDITLYKESVKEMVNAVARAHGPFERRGGFELVDIVADKDTARVFGFNVSEHTAFAIVVYPGGVRIVQSNGLIEPDNVVLNTHFSAGGTNWTVVNASGGASIFNNVAGTVIQSVTDEVGSSTQIRQSMAVVADTDYYVTLERPWALIYPNMIIKVGTAAGLADIATFTSNVRTLKQLVHIPVAVVTAHITLQLLGDGTPKLAEATSFGLYKKTGAVISFAAPYTAGDMRAMQAVQPPQSSQSCIYLLHPLQSPYKLSYNVTTGAWTFAVVAFVGTPADWVAGNQPGALTFYQGRSWWSGVPSKPETFWASKSGAIEDMTAGALDNDGLSFTLSYRGAIRWMLGVRNLLIGTESGEFIVSSDAGVITPSDIKVEQQSAFGSAAINGYAVGNNAAYITPDKRKVRLMGFRWEEDIWVSLDLTFASEHITGNGLQSLDWAPNPENLLMAVDTLGNMIWCTYEPTLKIAGWHRHINWAPMFDLAVHSYGGRDVIWAIRRVNAPGSVKIYVETYDPSIFMDSFKQVINQFPTQIISGYDHLEGQSVQIMADDAVQPDQVVSAGKITLQSPAIKVVAGKQFITSVTTLPWDTPDAQQTTMGMRKRYGKVWARCLASGNPVIDGQLAPSRRPPDPMDKAEPFSTYDVPVVSMGWNQQETLNIKQDKPLPLVVLALFGEINVGAN